MQNKERKEGKVGGGRKEEGREEERRGGRKDEHEVMIDAISSD